MSIAIVLALIISIVNGYIFWWSLVSIIILLFLNYFDFKFNLNLLSGTLVLFCLLLIFNMLFIHPSYDEDAGYLVAIFVSGYFLFSYADDKLVKQVLYILAVIFVLLSIWAFIQYTFGIAYVITAGKRANTIFYTANTLAASINIILLPFITLYVFDKEKKWLYLTILMLFLGLLVTKSRGGWVAFSLALLFIFIFANLIRVTVGKNKIKKLVLGLLLVLSFYSVTTLIEFNQKKEAATLTENVNRLVRSKHIGGGALQALHAATARRDRGLRSRRRRRLTDYS